MARTYRNAKNFLEKSPEWMKNRDRQTRNKRKANQVIRKAKRNKRSLALN